MSKEDFYKEVYRLVREVPEGRVTTYGAIAKALGEPTAARRVGYAMRISGEVNPPVPAHRVVNSGGRISCQSSKVHQFLINEDVSVNKDKVVEFRKIYWDAFANINQD